MTKKRQIYNVTQGLQSLGSNVGVNLLRMLDKEYRLHLPGFANDNDFILHKYCMISNTNYR